MFLLDNTVISNFAHIGRIDLLRQALPEACVPPQVLEELQTGADLGRLPAGDWDWLICLPLAPDEQEHLRRIQNILGLGEAACVAVGLARQRPDEPVVFFSDDRDARSYAHRNGLVVSGTLGVLMRLVDGQHLTLADADAHLQAMIACGYHAPVTSLSELLP